MSHQGRQAFERRAVGEAGFDGVEACALQASNQSLVERRRFQHGPMVASSPYATEGNGPTKTPATDCNSTSGALQPDLAAAVDLAAARCGLTDKAMAAAMGISAGTWSKQKNGVDGCHIQLDRLALLPDAFHVEFSRIYASLVGLHVAHESIADLLIGRVSQLLIECHSLAAQLRRVG